MIYSYMDFECLGEILVEASVLEDVLVMVDAPGLLVKASEGLYLCSTSSWIS